MTRPARPRALPGATATTVADHAIPEAAARALPEITANGRGRTALDGELRVYEDRDERGLGVVGIDLGATITRIAIAVPTPHGVRPVVRVRYFTGRRPERLRAQVAESLDIVEELSGRRPRRAAICVAGPVDAADRFVLTNVGWPVMDAHELLAPDLDVRIVVNDLTVGLHELARDRLDTAGEVLWRSGPAGLDECGRTMKFYQGTGVNIGLHTPGGEEVAMEYGHLPYPGTDDAATVGFLRAYHGRDLITVEDVVGGRGLGPTVFAHLSAYPGVLEDVFPEVARRTAGHAANGHRTNGHARNGHAAGGPAAGADRAAAALAATAYRAALERMAGLRRRRKAPEAGDGELPITALAERFGQWSLSALIENGDSPVARDILATYMRRFARTVLCAAQVFCPDVVYVGNHLFTHDGALPAFVASIDADAPRFAAASGFTRRMELRRLPELRHEDMLAARLLAGTVEASEGMRHD